MQQPVASRSTFLSPPSPLLPPNPLRILSLSSKTLAFKNHKKLSVISRRSDYFDPQRLAAGTPEGSPVVSQPPPPSKVFVGHSIYKGKAALTVEPRAPEFTSLESGAFKVSKEGFVLLQFAPAAGTRQYDWSRKQVFSLSITEIGTLISLGAKESCEFFHDPFKGKSDEGKVRKVLKVEPLPDGSGHFFHLSVQNRLLGVDESIYIPISRAEFAILNSAFNVGMPLQIISDQRTPSGQIILPQDRGLKRNGEDEESDKQHGRNKKEERRFRIQLGSNMNNALRRRSK